MHVNIQEKLPIRDATPVSVVLRHQYGIYRVKSRTTLEREKYFGRISFWSPACHVQSSRPAFWLIRAHTSNDHVRWSHVKHGGLWYWRTEVTWYLLSTRAVWVQYTLGQLLSSFPWVSIFSLSLWLIVRIAGNNQSRNAMKDNMGVNEMTEFNEIWEEEQAIFISLSK